MEQTRAAVTVAGTASYAFPQPTVFKDCGWIRLQSAATQSYRELPENSERALLDQFGDVAQGVPRTWARTGNSYLFGPIPNAVFAQLVKQYEYPADIAVGDAGHDADSNFVTLYWSQVLELGVTARGLWYYGKDTAATNWSQMFEGELAAAIKIDRERLSAKVGTLAQSIAAGAPAHKIRGGFRRLRSDGSYDWMP